MKRIMVQNRIDARAVLRLSLNRNRCRNDAQQSGCCNICTETKVKVLMLMCNDQFESKLPTDSSRSTHDQSRACIETSCTENKLLFGKGKNVVKGGDKKKSYAEEVKGLDIRILTCSN